MRKKSNAGQATESRGGWDPGAGAFVNEHFLAAT